MNLSNVQKMVIWLLTFILLIQTAHWMNGADSERNRDERLDTIKYWAFFIADNSPKNTLKTP